MCTNIVLNVKTNTQKNKFCTQHVLNLYLYCNSMNNLSSYCGLTDARMRASEKDLPVQTCKLLEVHVTKNSNLGCIVVYFC